MASTRFTVGDEVYVSDTEDRGVINKLYPELNLAIIDNGNSLVKAKITNLYKIVCTNEDEAETKRRNLLDRIKGVFTRDSYV